jgi:hypothetical protein
MAMAPRSKSSLSPMTSQGLSKAEKSKNRLISSLAYQAH